MNAFFQTIQAAIADIEAHGYDSQARIDGWLGRIEQAARESATPDHIVQEAMSRAMHGIYGRMIDGGGYTQVHKDVARFTVDRLRPKLRAELDRRLMANASLIKLNREQMIDQTRRRFIGWSTSVPAGGSRAVDKAGVKADLKKSFSALPFEERRVLIDQGHKLSSELNNIIAVDGGAIAAEWKSHWRQPGYHYDPDHKALDGKVFAIRSNWAIDKGLMTKGDGYTDEVIRPAERPFCFPADSKIPFADGVEKAYRRWYDGELTEIITCSGKSLRATPNHPVLTPSGWKAIGLLNEGDDVIEIADELIERLEKDESDNVPTIAEIFSSLQERGIVETTNHSAADFHGDGSDGDVNIVSTAWPLRVDLITLLAQRGNEFDLAEADSSTSLFGSLNHRLQRLLLSAKRIVSRFDEALSPFFSLSLHPNPIGAGGVASIDAEFSESFQDSSARRVHSFGDGKTAFAGKVSGGDFIDIDVFPFGRTPNDPFPDVESEGMQSIEQRRNFPADDLCNLTDSLPFVTKKANVVKVNRSRFSGHVFNLQTRDGWYVSNGILAHNCRCQYRYLYNLRDLPSSMLTNKGEQSLASVQT